MQELERKCEECGKIYISKEELDYQRFYYFCPNCQIKFEKKKIKWRKNNKDIINKMGIKPNKNGDYKIGNRYITLEMINLLPTSNFKKMLIFIQK